MFVNPRSVTTITGRLGKDADFQYEHYGQGMARFSVAVDESTYARGVRTDQTEWFPVVLRGKLAESIYRHLKRGTLVQVVGSMRSKSLEAAGPGSWELRAVSVSLLGREPIPSENSTGP